MNGRTRITTTTSDVKTRESALRRRCEQIAVDLSAYVDGELGSEEMTRPRCRVEAHLEACPDCRSLANAWSGVVEVLAVSDVPERPWFAAEFRRRLEAEERDRSDRWSWLSLRLVPIAVAVLGLTLGVWVRFELDRDRVSETMVDRILRIQDLEASTLASALASTAVSADGERRRDGFDLDELLISAGGMEEAGGTDVDLAMTSSVVDEAEPIALARFEKDR